MRRLRCDAWVTLVAILAVLPCRSAAAQDVWALASVQVPLVSPVALRVTGFTLTDVQLRGGWVELRTRVTPWLVITPALLRSVGDDDLDYAEWRPRIDASLTGSMPAVTLTSRIMLERRHIRTGSGNDEARRSVTMFRWRLRADIRQPILHITPFATAEYFRDLTAGLYKRSWVTGGISLSVPHWQFEPQYLRRLERNAPDGDAVQLAVTWFPL